MRIGFGLPKAMEFLAAGIPLGLSVDTVELTGNADMFGIMKLVQNVENGTSENEFKLTARRVLELATIEGARSMGISNIIGSLTVGKRADDGRILKRGGKLTVMDGRQIAEEAAAASAALRRRANWPI